jgi:hypothetical protein
MPKKKLTAEEKKEHLEAISFNNLVKAIDEKWSHTYVDPPKEEDLEFFLDQGEFNSSL